MSRVNLRSLSRDPSQRHCFWTLFLQAFDISFETPHVIYMDRKISSRQIEWCNLELKWPIWSKVMAVRSQISSFLTLSSIKKCLGPGRLPSVWAENLRKSLPRCLAVHMSGGSGFDYHKKSYGRFSALGSLKNAKKRDLRTLETEVLGGVESGQVAESTVTIGPHEAPLGQKSAQSDRKPCGPACQQKRQNFWYPI